MNNPRIFRRLGDYIERCEGRNSMGQYSISDMRGVNNEGRICNSIAKTDGLDLSAYKIAHKGDFIYNPARLDLGSISRLKEDACIVSTLYVIFRVRRDKENVLLPDYLEMWIHRSEFHRYVSYVNWGSAREYFWYDDMCEIYLPVPDIDTQRRIVSEYQTVEARIDANERLVGKLKETARIIYKKMFVDGINSENLPEGWKLSSISDIASLKVGGDKPAVFSTYPTEDCQIPVYANGTDNEGVLGFTDKAVIFERCVTITARGTIGCCFLRKTPFFPIVRLIVVKPKKSFYEHYLFQYYSAANLQGDGSVQSQLTVPQLLMEKVLIPKELAVKEYHDKAEPLDQYIEALNKENKALLEVRRVLLSKMS